MKSTTVYDAFATRVRQHPERAAIEFEGRTLSYGQLSLAVDVAAGNLSKRGIGRGTRFAAYGQNSPDHMVCYYAAAKLGAVFVPINPNMTAAEVGHVVRHSAARLLLHDEMVADAARRSAPTDIAVPLAALSEPIASGGAPAELTHGHDDFLIIYTSGTTGMPKAIVLDHRAQTAAPYALTRMWGLTETDITVVALPLGYLYGLSTAAAAGLQSGGKVAILRRFHPRDVLDALLAHRATVFHGVPTMFAIMLDYCEQHDLKIDLSGMRALICAGAPLPDAVRRRFAERFGKSLQDYYALTEATPVFGRYADDPAPVPDGSAGRAAPGLEIKIVRSDGTACAPGEEGELLVRAAATMTRYLDAPEQTAAAFHGGLFRSGDLGRQDADGYFYITGRIKDIIIRGGANISPTELEAVLARHPAVGAVAVVGAPDPTFGEVPVAFIVPRPGASPLAEDLIVHAEAVLADFKVPRAYFVVDEFPLGKTGKVDRLALKRRLEQASSGGRAAPIVTEAH